MYDNEKVCLNHCPNCGVDEGDNQDMIDWGAMDHFDGGPGQPAECKKCGCIFTEFYSYDTTMFTIGQVLRVPCPDPLNKFYNFMDEVPVDVRVSTAADCEKCDEKPCNVKHCLIEPKIPIEEQMALAAEEILSDFDTYGEVIQTGLGQEYTPDTAIGKLRAAIKKYREINK